MNGHVHLWPWARRDRGATALTEHRPKTLLANLPKTSSGDCVHRLLRLRGRRETHEEGTNYWGEVECST